MARINSIVTSVATGSLTLVLENKYVKVTVLVDSNVLDFITV